MTPYELVQAHYRLPFELYPFQSEDVNTLAPRDRTALYWEPGLGKTAGATHCALYKLETGTQQIVVLMPPLLISQWARWLGRITRIDGSPISVLTYRGSPAERRAMKLNATFILMGIQIFKRDIERIEAEIGRRRLHVILDEAQCIKDVSTANYKTYRDFVSLQTHQLLTGTPLNHPLDAYSYIKLVAPTVYRNLSQFEQIHVAERDFFKNPVAYANLDLLKSNLQINASRKTKEDVLLDLPACTVVPIEYDLDPAHMKLYRLIVNEQLLKYDDDTKLDLTSATALYHALGQVVCQFGFFAGDDSKVSNVYDLIDEVLDELGSAKLVVFANYRRTNEYLVKRYNCPAVYGEISAINKQKAVDRFIDDPNCRLITLQPSSGGVGVDGLQHVSSDILYIEPPVSVAQLTQSLSRVHREGQKLPVTVRMAIANGTIQRHVADRLAEREALVNPLQLSKAVLQAALLGMDTASCPKKAVRA